MPKKQSVKQISYEGLLSPFVNNLRIPQLIQTNIEIYNRGFVTFIDVLSSILGGFQPDMELQNKFCTIEDFLNEKNEEKEVVLPPREVFAFQCWFKLENHSPAKHIIQADDILNKFIQYWGNENFNHELIENLITLKIREKEGDKCHWIDRRAEFLDINKILNANKSDIQKFFLMPDFPLCSKKEANYHSRGFLSSVFGTGKKSIPDALPLVAKFYNDVDWNNLIQLSQEQSKEKLLALLDLSPKETLRQKFKLNSGNVQNWIQKLDGFFNKDENVNLEDVKIALEKWLKGKETLYPTGQWTINLLSVIENKIGHKYKVGKNKIDEWSEMLSTAWANIRSKYSGITNALKDKILKKKKLDSIKINEEYNKLTIKFCEEQIQKGNEEVYSFVSNQTNGIKDFIEKIRDSKFTTPEEFKSVITTLQEESKQKISPVFLSWLCDNITDIILDSSINPSDIEKEFKNISNYNFLSRKISSLHYPILTYPTKEKMLPVHYGNSRPSAKIISGPVKEHFRYNPKHINSKFNVGQQLKEDHEIALSIKFELINEKGEFESVILPLASKRLCREVFFQIPTADVKLPINNGIFRRKFNLLKNAIVNVPTQSDQLGILLRPDNDKWNKSKQPRFHVKITVPVSIEKREPTLQPGRKILSIDQGTRNWMSYAILEISNKENEKTYPVYETKSNNILCYVEVIETGNVSHINPNTSFDVLNDPGVKVTQNHLDFIKYFCDQLHIEDTITPNIKKNYSLNGLINILCKEYLKAIRTRIEIDQSFLDILTQLSNLALPRYQDRLNIWEKDYCGGLTDVRLRVYESLLRCYKSLDKRTNSQIVEVQNKISFFFNKLNNKKQERIRCLANSVVNLYNKHHCEMIVVENLDNLKTNKAKKGFQNRLLSRWCPRKTFEQLQQQCKTYGIFLKTVQARNSSHLDFAERDFEKQDDKWKPRLHYLSYEEADSTYNKHIKEKIKQCQKEPKENEPPYVKAWREFLNIKNINNYDSFIKTIEKEQILLIPRYDGSIYNSKAGLMSADEAAACQIGVRGIRYQIEKVSKK